MISYTFHTLSLCVIHYKDRWYQEVVARSRGIHFDISKCEIWKDKDNLISDVAGKLSLGSRVAFLGLVETGWMKTWMRYKKATYTPSKDDSERESKWANFRVDRWPVLADWFKFYRRRFLGWELWWTAFKILSNEKTSPNKPIKEV